MGEKSAEQMLTIHEVAARCAVSYAVIKARIREGKLRAVKIGGSWRIEPADFATYLQTEKDAAHTPALRRSMAGIDADHDLPKVPKRFS